MLHTEKIHSSILYKSWISQRR